MSEIYELFQLEQADAASGKPTEVKAVFEYPPALVKAMDRVLPHFVVHGLPAGIGGLVIAGIMAATMSSLDAGMNSLATVAVMDYYKRFFHREWKDERHYLWVSRGATVFFGVSASERRAWLAACSALMSLPYSSVRQL